MNTYKIQNEFLTVTLSDMGGEMQSVQVGNSCRLWRGDATFWKYHAPFLFPIVGRLNGGVANIQGKSCQMNQHGLCRISEHTVISQSENSIEFCFASSSETREFYPYDFEFHTMYTLLGNKIEIIITIKNTGESEMLASVGAHPAFPIDLHAGDTLENYQIEFEKTESDLVQLLISPSGLSDGEKKVDSAVKVVEISESSLNGTIVFKNFQSESVSLVRKSSGERVTANLKGHPIIAFWKGENAPFLCLEPWNGIADPVDFDGDFANKPYVEKFNSGEEKTFDFSLTFE